MKSVAKPLLRCLTGIFSGALLVIATACTSVSYPPAPAKIASDDYTYIIGAGDSLNIIVWRNPELSMAVPVRPDGKVAAPLVEEIVAQGKTSTELARDVEKQLSKYVRDPVVTVLVTSRALPPWDFGLYRGAGLDPRAFRVIAVKAAAAHRSTHDAIACANISIATPGASPGDLRSVPYRGLRRPIHPLDADPVPR